MDSRIGQFLAGVLGSDGQRALVKAMKNEAFASAIVPRTILAWMSLAAQYDYEGSIPGVTNTFLTFKKSEGGFDGAVTLGQEVFKFHDASVYHVAGAVAVALGVGDAQVDGAVRTVTLQRLGKSIDTLVKARVAVDELRKRKKLFAEAKKDEPGAANKPRSQMEPVAPVAPEFAPRLPKPLKKPGLKVTKAEAAHRCSLCGHTQFSGDNFTGCICFNALNRSNVSVEKSKNGYLLQLRGSDWDSDAIIALKKAMQHG